MGPQLYRCGNANRCLRTCRRSPGFNGAATLSLRKREAGEGNPAWPFVLQWGRNFIVAEIGWPRHTAARSPTSFNGAATLSLRKCENDTIDTDSITLLQWGRNFIVAEMYYNAVHGAMAWALQWGRNFIVAEIQDGRIPGVPHSQASMGPQLYRCGNT